MSDLAITARRLLFDLAVISFHGKTSLTIQKPRPPMLELVAALMVAVPGAYNAKYRAFVILVGPWAVAVFDVVPEDEDASWSIAAGMDAGAELVRLARGEAGRRGGGGRGRDRGVIDTNAEERP